MILPRSIFFWLFQCSLWLLGNADNEHHVRGIPGKDYPNYEIIPQTSFRCSEQLHIPGLYADPETGCQMFHHCYEHRHESFLCPPGTIFNQAILACDYWYSAECSEATLHKEADSPEKVISFETKTEFVPKKKPSVNIFDKMASLYEFKEPVPTSSKNYRSNAYSLDESNHFSDEQILGMHTNMIENQKYSNSYLEVANLHDRREGVLIESPGEFSSTEEKNNKNDLRSLKDSFTDFESSGELEDLDEHEFVTDNLLLLNDTEEHADFEKQYFAYNNEGDHLEHHTKQSNHESNDEILLIDSYTDKQASSSKENFASGDKFVRRQSGNSENPNDKRKTKRRKPIYTIKTEEKLEHFIVTEKLKDKTEISSNNLINYPNSYLKEVVPEFKSLSTPAPSRTKRRKPILIDLDDLPQYNVDNGQNVVGDTKTSSINYEVNFKSEVPDFPISAEEISVKLFPSKVEREPANGYLLDTTERYNVESDRNMELSNLKNLASHIYDTSTLTTLKDIDRYEEVSMNLGKVYPKRKKNILQIIDSEDDRDVYIENKEPTDATIYTTEFEDEVSTQSLNENFESFDKFSQLNMDYHDNEKEHEIENDSVEVGTEQNEDSYNFVSPYTHIEVSDGEGGTYFTEINPEIGFNIKKYEGISYLEDEVNSINSKSFQDFEVNKLEKLHDSTYVTTEFPISEVSTQMPLEIQYGEDTTSHIYFIPNTVAQSTFDNLGATEIISDLFPETLDKNHDVRESFTNDFEYNPSYQTSVDSNSYKLLENSKIKEALTEYSHSENDDLQNLLKQLPTYTYETNKERNISQNSEFEKSHLNYEDKILHTNVSRNITQVESAISRKEIEEYDPLLDTELQEYLENENSNLENNFNSGLIKDIYTEPSISLVEDYSSKSSLDGQYQSYHPISDVDTLEAHDLMQDEQELSHETVPPKLLPDLNAYLSKDVIKTDTLEKIKQEAVGNKGGEFDETSYFKAASINFDDSQTENLDELESDHATTSAYGFETQNIPSYLQTNSFNNKPNVNSKATEKDASKIGTHKFVSSTEPNKLSKGYSNLEQNIPGSIITGASTKTTKYEPVRRPRAFISPHQMENIPFETFGSQNFANLPYLMLKLKQSGMRNVLPDSIHKYGLESMTYSTRTGNLLQSPKISKLISIGKNLIRAKKAKFRMLGRYTNYFKTDQ